MIISKKNDVYLTVEVDKGIARELSDFFTFEVPGAKFMPQYRNRMWDGRYACSQYKLVKYILDYYLTLKSLTKTQRHRN